MVSGEVGPPKGTNINEMLQHIDLLKDRVDALNVTDNQSSVMRISSLAVCRLIREHGGEPILQLTCRDGNGWRCSRNCSAQTLWALTMCCA